MPTISPHGTLNYDDESSLHQWQAAHDMRHTTYVKEMARRGNAITTTVLSGKIDKDWWGRHASAHSALNRILGADPLHNSVSLSAGWANEHEFYDWMQRHTLLHRYTDQQLGLVN